MSETLRRMSWSAENVYLTVFGEFSTSNITHTKPKFNYQGSHEFNAFA